MRSSARLVASLCPFLTLFVASESRAEVHQVPEDFLTIQAAIDASTDGDIVDVQNRGVALPYFGPGNVNLDFFDPIAGRPRAITVRARGGAIPCVIRLDDFDYAVSFHSGEVAASVFQGFTIRAANPATQRAGAIRCENSSSPKIVGCAFQGTRQQGGAGGAVYCSGRSNPMLLFCTFTGCAAVAAGFPLQGGEGGALFCDAGSSPIVVGSTFESNGADRDGGAIYLRDSRALISQTVFYGNTAGTGFAGGAVASAASTPVISNCLFGISPDGGLGNRAGRGAALAAVGLARSQIAINNCTFAHNETIGAPPASGAIDLDEDETPESTATITNSILWANTPAQLIGSTARAIVNFTDIEGGWPGTMNFIEVPQFVARDVPPQSLTPWSHRYYLSRGAPDPLPASQCFDRGSDDASALGLAAFSTRTDLAADVDAVDVGYHISINCDASTGNTGLDTRDIALGIVPDCNHNLVPDSCDIAAGTSPDINSDDVPDDCQCIPDAASFTTDEDFDLGYPINVRHLPPGNVGKLVRNETATPLPFVWVPIASTGTVARIEIDPAGVARFVGEYRTAPNAFTSTNPSPSRTSVSLDGDLWIGNRNNITDNGSVVRIGHVLGGTRCNADGSLNLTGDYLKPPFIRNTCIDRDGDGLIATSRGRNPDDSPDVRPWWWFFEPEPDAALAEDECICNYVPVKPVGVRIVAVDKDNDLWVGGNDIIAGDPSHSVFELRDGDTGQLLATMSNLLGATGYGGLVDCDGILWAVSRNGSTGLFRFDTATLQPAAGPNPLSINDSYGLGIDVNGLIWNSRFMDDRISWVDPVTLTVTQSGILGHTAWDRGVAVTFADNDIWVADSLPGQSVLRLDYNAVANTVCVREVIDLGTDGTVPTGLAVDHVGNVWVTCNTGSTIKRITPSPHPTCGNSQQQSTVATFALPGQPYSYSDQTGQVTLHTTATGTWSVVHDSERPGAEWHLVRWNRPPAECGTPAADLLVEIRAADTRAGLASQPYVAATEGRRLDDVTGRFVEARIRIRGSCPGEPFVSQQLCNFSVSHGVGDMDCSGHIDFFDTDPFLQAIIDPAGYAAAHPDCDRAFADIDGNGLVNFFDIDPYVALLFAPQCPK